MTATQADRETARDATTRSHPVLVGADETSGSDLAVEWAAREAVARDVPLRIVRTYTWPPVPSWSTPNDGVIASELRMSSARIAERALRWARDRVPGVRADELVIEGRATDLLVAASRTAGLVVLGSRHLNLVQRVVLGGISGPVSSHSACPVVVVGAPAAPEANRIVVGVQDEPGDETVLAFAFDHAARHGLAVEPILCIPHDHLARAQWRGETAAPDWTQRVLAESLAGWRERCPDVDVHTGVERGTAVDALVDAAAAQSLLVVGRARRRHLSCGAVHEPVAHGVLRKATCPVAVVPT